MSPRRFEQAHVVMGYESPSHREPDFYAAQVLSGLFGGGMSSRLCQEVREKRGLCYSIYSSAWGLNDTGMFNIHAATGPTTVGTLIDVVATEFDKAAASRPKADEVRRAKAQLKAGLLMGLESPIARAEQMARQMLALGRLVPTAELIEKVDAVNAEQVRRLAERPWPERARADAPSWTTSAGALGAIDRGAGVAHHSRMSRWINAIVPTFVGSVLRRCCCG